MFTAALFAIVKTWKQPKCPSKEERWYIYTMEYYLAIKRNEITAFAATWMELKIIMLSEVSQTVIATSNAITDIWNLKKKGHNEFLCRTDTDSQILKNLWFPKETGWGWGGGLGVWDGHVIKLGCDDCCITINAIKFIF